jgi:uncharacterized membrane protein
MADLIAVTYPDEHRASEVLATLRRLSREYLIDLEDAVVVTKNAKGKFRLHQSVDMVASGAVSGAWWGALIGLIFTLPFPFLAPLAWLGITAASAGVGAASGAIAGSFGDYGIDNNFVRQLSEQMKDNSSALFVLVKKSTPDKVIPEVARFGGTVLQTSLPHDIEKQLQDALAEKAQVAA